MAQLVVLHRPQPGPWSWGAEFPEWALWGTCLRQIAVGLGNFTSPSLEKEDQVLVDLEAYRLLLEVVCGLHSPVLGETEVFGQFKRFVEQLKDSESPAKALLPTLRQIIGDAKAIRHSHLIGLGSQSYGSLVRREVPDGSAVHILGGGQLAQKILPWLGKKEAQVTLHVRSVERAPQNGEFQVRPISDKSALEGVLVVAAPLSARELEVWLDQRQVKLTKIIDLRGEGAFDPLTPRAPVLDLPQVMQRLSHNRAEQTEMIAAARHQIMQCAQAYASAVKVRPLGWDDICA
ncbi:MAG: hypothetical protein AB7N80_06630 [Bdellovibrionales bacterium]